MRFVLGKPHKLVKPGWYLVLDSREAEEQVANTLRKNSKNFALDPHKSYFTNLLALVSMRLAMEIDCGLHDRMGYYVNREGGMCPQLYKITEERDCDNWPDVPRISISRWPNGKHFYVKVDDIDIEWNRRRKWCTERAAQKAAESFIAAEDRDK